MNRLSEGLLAAAEAVLATAPDLNRLDAAAGDGDLGVTMSTVAHVVLESIAELDGCPPRDVFRTLGAAIARDAPATSGALVATALLRAARHGSDGEIDGLAVAGFLAAAEAARLATEAGAGVAVILAHAAEAAENGARATVSMQPRHGRAGWLHERSMGHEDAGARLVAIVLGSAAKSAEEAPTTRGDN